MKEIETVIERKEPMSIEEARVLLAGKVYRLPGEMEEVSFRLKAQAMRCIDDREHRIGRELPHVAIPEAGLGVLFSTLGAISILERRGKTLKIPFGIVAETVETVIGTPSYHTDDGDALRDDALIWGGCGHCALSIKECDKYFLSDAAVKFLKEEYLPSLFEREKPVLYKGAHRARAVVIVDTIDAGVNTGGEGDGERVYVYHRSWHDRVLVAVASALYWKILGVQNTAVISQQNVLRAIEEAARTSLIHMIEHLAKHLPKILIRELGRDGPEFILM